MRPQTRRMVGQMVGPGVNVSLDAETPAALPGGTLAYAVPRGRGGYSVLLTLPPGAAVTCGQGARLELTAEVLRDQPFRLEPGAGDPWLELRFAPLSLWADASELGLTRCGLCHRPLTDTDRVVRCDGCQTALCATLCARADTCGRCGDGLDPDQAAGGDR